METIKQPSNGFNEDPFNVIATRPNAPPSPKSLTAVNDPFNTTWMYADKIRKAINDPKTSILTVTINGTGRYSSEVIKMASTVTNKQAATLVQNVNQLPSNLEVKTGGRRRRRGVSYRKKRCATARKRSQRRRQ